MKGTNDEMATTISGRVTVEQGLGATGAVVELHNATDDVVTQVRVDAEGRYRFHVSEGLWKVKVWDQHGRRGEGQTNVLSGEDRPLDVHLETEQD